MVAPSLPDTEVYLGQIERIRTAISKLDAAQLIDISHFIRDILESDATNVQMEARSARLKEGACIHCGVIGRSQKWGKSKSGTQRFKCGACGKTYSATSGTPVYRLRFRNEWNRYLTLMRSHIAIRTLRDEHGFKHHADTLLRWRHRFLAFMTPNPTQQLAGLIEADEKFFRTSYKGTRAWKRGQLLEGREARERGGANQRGLSAQQVPVLTAVDRSGAIRQSMLPNMQWPSFSQVMTPWIEPESVICSDGNQVYPAIAKATGCEHIRAKQPGGANVAGLSIGRIDAYHRDIENLINRRCMGVSTRYLLNYFAWARRQKQHEQFGSALMEEMMAA